jgi:hypothetical protein
VSREAGVRVRVRAIRLASHDMLELLVRECIQGSATVHEVAWLVCGIGNTTFECMRICVQPTVCFLAMLHITFGLCGSC